MPFRAVLQGMWPSGEGELCLVLEGDRELPAHISTELVSASFRLDWIGSFEPTSELSGMTDDVGDAGKRPPTGHRFLAPSEPEAPMDIGDSGGRPPTGG
jgi:hypothetical protein